MIRTLAAFTWLRWRLMINGLSGGDRRDTVERVSRVASFVVPALVAASSLTSVLVATALGAYTGWFLAHGPAGASVLPAIRVLLLVATVAAILIPLAIGAHGSARRSTRLLLLPLSQRQLHLLQLMAGLTDPWVLVVFPGLMAFGTSLAVSGLIAADAWKRSFVAQGFVAMIAAVGVVAALGALASIVTLSVSWLVRDRRRSEFFVIIFVLGLTCVAMTPALVSRQFAPETLESPTVFTRLIADPPAWMEVLPSELYGGTVSAAGARDHTGVVVRMTMLFAEGFGLYCLSGALHRKTLESLEGERSPRRQHDLRVAAVRFAGMWPGTAAVALAQLRTALRSVRGRLVVLLPAPVVSLLALTFRQLSRVNGGQAYLPPVGPVAFGAGILFGLYAAQAFTLNQFASDRAGLTLEFLAPIRDIDLVRGKTIGCGVLIGAGALLSLLAACATSPGGSVFAWLAILVGGAAAYIVVSPVAAWLSIALPVSADLSKTGMAGNPHSLAMLAGSALVAATTLPVVIAMGLLTPFTALLAMITWLAIAVAVAVPLLTRVAGLLGSRRENLALVAQGRG